MSMIGVSTTIHVKYDVAMSFKIATDEKDVSYICKCIVIKRERSISFFTKSPLPVNRSLAHPNPPPPAHPIPTPMVGGG